MSARTAREPVMLVRATDGRWGLAVLWRRDPDRPAPRVLFFPWTRLRRPSVADAVAALLRARVPGP